MLNIWGRISSINVRKVVWCAQELGLDFQRTEAGGKFGVVQTPEYQRLNPNALVPAIDDGEGEERVTLWESNVIVRYLCAKHSMGRLYPDLLSERFDAERWMDWQQTTLNRASAGAFRQWVRTPAAQRNLEVIEQSVTTTEPLFAMLDAHLATRTFMLGDNFTMADIPVGCEAHRWFGLPQTEYTRPIWPNVERWFGDLRSRAGARGVLDLALE
ncbi:glutathione S-transferase [Variovorax sp. J22P240]|uniref:glutathione S-transferase family protein n=1 Tax=unclassified Variovorax TaxID=663243 RepID=UPI0025774C57|nr:MULTISPECIES: glutathione S-transferase [unclassified Variovorax]MDM0002675.1 glutathione S-transferase [Variovorax sp. J22P240]MDM0053695.1 glutathione S-transferase [Variovorax sp. J22R115]